MRVGVDIRVLTSQLTGIGRYTLEMCRALLASNQIELFLYSPKYLDLKAFNLEKATLRAAHFNTRALKLIWSITYLPLWINKDQLDIFWGPAHRLPKFISKSILTIVTIHDLVWKQYPETMHPITYSLERIFMPYAIKRSGLIIADSFATAKDIQLYFPRSAKKLSVIYPAASIKLNTESETLPNINGINKPYFLFVGTLEPRKNLKRVLEALEALDNSVKNKYTFIIAGGKGWGDVNLWKEIRRLNLENTVKVLGYVDENILTNLYLNAAFLCMPSLYEGFGIPIIEAMQFGIPVLTSANSSMQEIVGKAGLLVDPSCLESIKQGLFEMITNDYKRKEYASFAKENAGRFNWQVSAEKLINLCKKHLDL